GPLPDVRARPRGRRGRDRRALAARRLGVRRDARGLHRLAGRAARRPGGAGRRGETDLHRGAPGLRPARRPLQPRPRAHTRSVEDVAGGAPQRAPGGGRGGPRATRRNPHWLPSLRRRLRRGHALRPVGRSRRPDRRPGRAAGHRDARAPRGGRGGGPRQAPRKLRHARERGRRARLEVLLGHRHLAGGLALRTRPRRAGLRRACGAFRARGRKGKGRTPRRGYGLPVRRPGPGRARGRLDRADLPVRGLDGLRV
ncbi:MAG: hypothetical protein AVDCRST_MAG02-3376, partial [uncultured Rubrobacteraceae bacterium]